MGKGDKKSRRGKIKLGSYGKSRRKKGNQKIYIKLNELKYWSIEKLFAFIGNYDFTANVQFKYNSDSYRKYGQSITGEFYFTKAERRLLKIKINSGIARETEGDVKFKIFLKEELTDEQIKELLKVGFNSNDILDVTYYSYKHNKTYFKKNQKRLSEPMKIHINDSNSLIDDYAFAYRVYKLRIDMDDSLTNDEKIDMVALQRVLAINETDEKYIHNEFISSKKIEFDFVLDKMNFLLGRIERLSEEVLKNKTEQVIIIINKEFQKAGINSDKASELVKYIDIYSLLIDIGMDYQEKIVLYSSNPKVILDFEGFIHVAFRHCPLFNIGEANQNKSRIPYRLEDIKGLIESCLQTVEDDIKLHFQMYPDKRFSKFGEELIRFNGDYYEVHINPQGRLETFYNHER